MAIRNILTDENKRLRKTSRPVTDFDDRLHTLLDDMAETLAEANGVAWQAPRWVCFAASSLWIPGRKFWSA